MWTPMTFRVDSVVNTDIDTVVDTTTVMLLFILLILVVIFSVTAFHYVTDTAFSTIRCLHCCRSLWLDSDQIISVLVMTTHSVFY